MNTFIEILITLTGVIITGFVIYLIMDLYDIHQREHKNKTVLGFIKNFGENVFYKSKAGIVDIYDSSTKTLSEDVYDTGVALGEDIEDTSSTGLSGLGKLSKKAYNKTKKGLKAILNSSTIPLAEDVDDVIDNVTGSDKTKDSPNSGSGSFIGDKVLQGIDFRQIKYLNYHLY